jgi:succinate dehydrogenase / fumarate reductase membrane anchor subunit
MSIGAKRLVVGAHYGLRDWLVQRLTALVLAAYAVFLPVYVLVSASGPLGYDTWAALFVPLWMKVVTLMALLALVYHAWIGVRDIWMDYVKPAGLRLVLQLASVLWLVACAIWSVQILWRV